MSSAIAAYFKYHGTSIEITNYLAISVASWIRLVLIFCSEHLVEHQTELWYYKVRFKSTSTCCHWNSAELDGFKIQKFFCRCHYGYTRISPSISQRIVGPVFITNKQVCFFQLIFRVFSFHSLAINPENVKCSFFGFCSTFNLSCQLGCRDTTILTLAPINHF